MNSYYLTEYVLNLTPKFQFDPPKDLTEQVYQGLFEFNRPHFPQEPIHKIGCFLYQDDGELVAGLYGDLFTSSLFIETIWVEAECRGQGLGRQLLQHTEEQVREHGVSDLFLDTYSFQAAGFYQKLGFKQVGCYRDFPTRGVDKLFFQKRLR